MYADYAANTARSVIMSAKVDELIDLKTTLLASLLTFTRVFYKELTGNEFQISNPIGRESHFITVCRELTLCAREPGRKTYIGIPPGHGKSTMLIMFVCWTMARYPDSKYLYISYAVSLASKHTETIKRIIQLPLYRKLFGITISNDARGKEYFRNNFGGEVAAFGSGGGIMGRDGGMPFLDRFSGCVLMDDMHKADDVHSDTMREIPIRTYMEGILKRLRGVNVSMIGIGQRLHEADLWDFIMSGKDGHKWHSVILKALDDARNALYPEAFPKELLEIEEEFNPYVHAAQNQQNPLPAGGGIFKLHDFPRLDLEPRILHSFVTCDTAETEDTRRDKTVFSHWGLYKIKMGERELDQYALHVIDCEADNIDSGDLEERFISFWHKTQLHRVPPIEAAIEKKSTGVTLVSVLKRIQGLIVRPIERSIIHGNKSSRFLAMVPYVRRKLISLPADGYHTEEFITHMTKITDNDSHRFDDICDTAYDAIKIALIDKSLIRKVETVEDDVKLKAIIAQTTRQTQQHHRNIYHGF
jgi:Uncharacterized protein conserved in bacteria